MKKERNQNMKLEKGFTFITEANCLLIITKAFKNGKCYADEFQSNYDEDDGEGVETVAYEYDEQDILIRKNTEIVYGVIDNTKRIIKNQTSFYFDKGLAKSVISELNSHICSKAKPYKVKEFYLIEK